MVVTTVELPDGASIAYQVAGEGPALVDIPNWATNMEALDSLVESRAWLESLAAGTRLMWYDQRGTGLSERGAAPHELAVWIDDLASVLDAAGMPSATLLGHDFSAPLALAFAARHPQRVKGLVLVGALPRLLNGDGYEAGLPAAAREAAVEMVIEGWGHPESTFNWLGAPGENRRHHREVVARIQRFASNRREVVPMVHAMFDLDVTGLLGAVTAPTLLVHAVGDRLVPVAHARYLAEHLPSARLVELPGDLHYPFFEDTDVVIDEILTFAGAARGRRRGPQAQLAVVWFSDIVGSTARLRELGDRRWSRLLDEHDRLADYYLTRYGGRLVKRLGDGVLALFGSAAEAVGCATRFTRACRRLGIDVRVGMHAGDVETRSDGEIAGLAVHAAQRVEGVAAPGEVLVTATLRDLLAGSGVPLHARGRHQLRGLDDLDLYAVAE